MPEFIGFGKIARLSREVVITEKIDGTNSQIYISDDGDVMAGSRNRWITPEDDNFGFAAWVGEHRDELLELGPGRHFGEWWGAGIQRGYGLKEKRFSLFNTSRWAGNDRELRAGQSRPPECCDVVPVLTRGLFSTGTIGDCLGYLRVVGSQAAPGFMRPEGVVVFYIGGNVFFKKTLEKDEEYKGGRRSSKQD